MVIGKCGVPAFFWSFKIEYLWFISVNCPFLAILFKITYQSRTINVVWSSCRKFGMFLDMIWIIYSGHLLIVWSFYILLFLSSVNNMLPTTFIRCHFDPDPLKSNLTHLFTWLLSHQQFILFYDDAILQQVASSWYKFIIKGIFRDVFFSIF